VKVPAESRFIERLKHEAFSTKLLLLKTATLIWAALRRTRDTVTALQFIGYEKWEWLHKDPYLLILAWLAREVTFLGRISLILQCLLSHACRLVGP
jgi:hypothetical protein